MILSYAAASGSPTGYKIAYSSGTAPANCDSGTQISSATVGTATSYAVTGLSASTSYSFRVCATNSAGISSGVTVSATTSATGGGKRRLFVTSSTGDGSWVGSLTNADSICNGEGRTALGSATSWTALLSTSTQTVRSRVNILSGETVYTTKAGSQLVLATGSAFWSGSGLQTSIKYLANGTAASANNAWTGSDSTGYDTLDTCNNWSTSDSGSAGTYGITDSTTSLWIEQSFPMPCNVQAALYCIEQ